MNEAKCTELLEAHGVKPTANRIVVLKELVKSLHPTTLAELESRIISIDKSNIFRALTLFKEHHLVHVLEDGGDGVRYELCHSHDGHQEDDDQHVHFHCTRCGSTFCLTETPIPPVTLPEGYEAETANFVMTGLCPRCARRLTRG